MISVTMLDDILIVLLFFVFISHFEWRGKKQQQQPIDKCFIQFIETNNYITFGTAIAAFYAPVTVMCVLYWRVWRETEKRQKDLSNLQAGKKNDSHRSNSRYLATAAEIITSDEFITNRFASNCSDSRRHSVSNNFDSIGWPSNVTKTKSQYPYVYSRSNTRIINLFGSLSPSLSFSFAIVTNKRDKRNKINTIRVPILRLRFVLLRLWTSGLHSS